MLGPLRVERTQTAGRPTTAKYLNEEQAIFKTTLFRTPRARAIHVEVVKVYAAWRTAKAPAPPGFQQPRP